ncbi:MAG: gamma-glutamyltransferase family protein [Abditibacteriales bacterium]|nr:gamma-glutamyltransferase family protein [Abditibacteriales bacterium]
MAGFTTRPVIQGRRGVVTAGHYLAAAVGFCILEQGGNAIDAAAAMVFCLNLLEPHNNGIGGEVPTLIYAAQERKVFAISGQGCAPKAMTIEWFHRSGIDLIPGDGLLPAMVPAVVGTWAEALARFGTMRFAQVLQPAIELAENGFPMYPDLHSALLLSARRFVDRYPATAQIYLRDGQPIGIGELVRNPDWANVLKRMVAAEERARGKGRIAGIEAARDDFYRGETAERIAAFVSENAVLDATGRANKGFMTYEDLATWQAKVEEPVTFHYRGYDVYKCPPWCQGPVFLQQLALLEGFDLAAMGHNSAEYLHTWIECAKLAFADREAYYGDPDFDDVPLDVLLSKDYNDARRNLISAEASRVLRPGGVRDDALVHIHTVADVEEDNRYARLHANDTTHCDAIDQWGNMVAATPSGGWVQSSPVIPGLGFCLGTRGQMFYLNPKRPNALQPGKRPRTTLTPSLVTKNGQPAMVFGTPGGDQQDQWTLQFFLNVVEFGMDLQEAIDAPTVHTTHFPSSFYPRSAQPGRVVVEGRIPEQVRKELERRGHEVQVAGDWSNGRVLAIRINPHGVREGAASPRARVAYAIGW